MDEMFPVMWCPEHESVECGECKMVQIGWYRITGDTQGRLDK